MFGIDTLELFRKGGIVMWPLLACSVLAVAIMIERTIVILLAGTNLDRLLSRLRPLIHAGKIVDAERIAAQNRKPVGNVARAYLEHWNSASSIRNDVVERTGAQAVETLERRLNWLAMLAQVTPLLGLLGTVLGLMSAFQAIDAKGSNVHASDLATGIWAKLINTAFGMAIAIPCLLAYYWLEACVIRVTNRMGWIVSHLNEWRAQEKTEAVEEGEVIEEASPPLKAVAS